jgi:site-specific recombinase XerD
MKTRSGHRECSIRASVVGEEIEMYVKDLRDLRYSPKSISIYQCALLDMDRFLENAGIPRVEDVTAKVLSDYRLSLAERGFSISSVIVYCRAVRRLFNSLEQKRRIFIDPAVGLVVRGGYKPLLHVPTEQDVKTLLAAPDTTTACGIRDLAILETAYATAARRAEIETMTLSSVSLATRTIRIMGKGARERIVPLTVTATACIAWYISDARPKFPSSSTDALWLGSRGALSAEGISFVFVKNSTAAGITPAIRPHAMRRACATHMLRNGASPLEIQKLLGHVNLSHLSRYLAVSIAELRQAHQKTRLGA